MAEAMAGEEGEGGAEAGVADATEAEAMAMGGVVVEACSGCGNRPSSGGGCGSGGDGAGGREGGGGGVGSSGAGGGGGSNGSCCGGGGGRYPGSGGGGGNDPGSPAAAAMASTARPSQWHRVRGDQSPATPWRHQHMRRAWVPVRARATSCAKASWKRSHAALSSQSALTRCAVSGACTMAAAASALGAPRHCAFSSHTRLRSVTLFGSRSLKPFPSQVWRLASTWSSPWRQRYHSMGAPEIGWKPLRSAEEINPIESCAFPSPVMRPSPAGGRAPEGAVVGRGGGSAPMSVGLS